MKKHSKFTRVLKWNLFWYKTVNESCFLVQNLPSWVSLQSVDVYQPLKMTFFWDIWQFLYFASENIHFSWTLDYKNGPPKKNWFTDQVFDRRMKQCGRCLFLLGDIKRLILVHKAMKLVPSYPISPVSHQDWHLQISWKCESDMTIILPDWVLSWPFLPKWSFSYSDIWNKYHIFWWSKSKVNLSFYIFLMWQKSAFP